MDTISKRFLFRSIKKNGKENIMTMVALPKEWLMKMGCIMNENSLLDLSFDEDNKRIIITPNDEHETDLVITNNERTVFMNSSSFRLILGKHFLYGDASFLKTPINIDLPYRLVKKDGIPSVEVYYDKPHSINDRVLRFGHYMIDDSVRRYVIFKREVAKFMGFDKRYHQTLKVRIDNDTVKKKLIFTRSIM